MSEPDFERRFGGLRRLYGLQGAQRVFDAHVVVVGLGGVGSWAAEALARSGVGRLTLIDMDHVSESNINRQIQALGSTVGMSKIEALRNRIIDINPACTLNLVDDFLTPDNLERLLPDSLVGCTAGFALLDACDQVKAKTAMAAWACRLSQTLVAVGAAGGKRHAQLAEVADLADVTHDPLLAQLRYRLRKHHGAKRSGPIGLPCVFSREPVALPKADCELTEGSDGSLNCHGYGSVVAVTATFGLVAAGCVLDKLADNFSH